MSRRGSLFLPLFLLATAPALKGGPQAIARGPSEALETFQQDGLPALRIWFSRADLSASSHLRLLATEEFLRLGDARQKGVMTTVASSWSEARQGKLVGPKGFMEVAEPAGMSLWRVVDVDTDEAVLVERWDAGNPLGVTGGGGRRGPWYGYLGGQARVAFSEETAYLSFNARLGTFLIANRLDTAFTYTTSLTTDVSSRARPVGTTPPDIASSSVGLLGRYHIPLSKKVSVHAGTQIATGPTYNLLTGLGIFTGAGVYDIGLSVGLNTGGGWNFSTGYNIFF